MKHFYKGRLYSLFTRWCSSIQKTRLKVTLLAVVALFGAAASLLVSRAQTGSQFDPQTEWELQQLAIQYPNEMNAELAKFKTEEELRWEQWVQFSILNPSAYEAEMRKQKTVEQLAAEDELRRDAAWAILDPVGYRLENGIGQSEEEKLAEAAQMAEIAAGRPVRQ